MRLLLLVIGTLLLVAGLACGLWAVPGPSAGVAVPYLGTIAVPIAALAWGLVAAAAALCGLTILEMIRAARLRAAALNAPTRGMPWFERFRGTGDLVPFTQPPLREGALFALCLTVGLIAALFGHLTIPRALVLALFAAAAISLAIHAVAALETDPMELQSGWGGLGGGLGGWRVSRPTVLILLALAFAGVAVAAAVQPKAAERPAVVAPVATHG